MSWIVPVDDLEMVCNGKVAGELALDSNRASAQVDSSIPLEASGWCVLRAFSDKAEYPILDLYPYATTSPVYVSVASTPVRSAADAAYFVAWIDRLIAAARGNNSWDTGAEEEAGLAMLEEARKKYAEIAEEASRPEVGIASRYTPTIKAE